MLKSCKYCGKIHDSKFLCNEIKKSKKNRWNTREDSKAYSFRKTNAWTQKSKQIRKRDRYLCLCCLNNLPGTVKQYNADDISVHHIIPLEEDFDSRLEELNLISVCGVHHEMCEAGKIARAVQRKLVEESIGAYE